MLEIFLVPVCVLDDLCFVFLILYLYLGFDLKFIEQTCGIEISHAVFDSCHGSRNL